LANFQRVNRGDVHVVVTEDVVLSRDTWGATWAGKGILLRAVPYVWSTGFRDPKITLAHELGHFVGWSGLYPGERYIPPDFYHSADKNNLMYKFSQEETHQYEPDCQWCELVRDAAREH
jgi:hypothetical protein